MTEAGYWLPAFCRQRWQLWPSLLYLDPAPQQLPTFHTPAKRKSSLPGSNMSSMPGSRVPWRQKPTVFLRLEAITRYYRPLSLKSSADVKRQLISPFFFLDQFRWLLWLWWFVRIARIPRFWHQELIPAEKPRVRVAAHNSSSASAQRRAGKRFQGS